jgi:cytoskeleton protein RodZ
VRKKSWVEAKVDGTTVLSRVMDEGETHRLDARDAVTLSLGNAGGVEYSLNGRPPTALGRDGEVRRNVVITAAGPAAEPAAGPAPIRASSPRPRRPSPTPVPQEEAPAVEPSLAPSPGPAV